MGGEAAIPSGESEANEVREMDGATLSFVLVGHVDHGKSTLIGRLLYDTRSLPDETMAELERLAKEQGGEVEFAFVMDHLEEERDQGITIDTAQTFFRSEKREYVIIDAPGHKEFIKNMITGASQAEAAILIVDAGEGVREQTRRHAALLAMLGLDQIAVVINKMDTVVFAQERFDRVAAELTGFLTTIGLTARRFVPLSARDGDNVADRSTRMPWYDGPTVLDVLDEFVVRPRPAEKPLRLPIQDVYEVEERQILVGRVESGTLRSGQEVLFLPGGSRATVQTVEQYLKPPLASAAAGESVGFTLDPPLPIERGQVACPPETPPRVEDSVRANIFWLSPEPFAVGEKLHLRCATQEVGVFAATIEKRIDSSSLEVLGENAKELGNHEIGELTLRTDAPIATEIFNDVPALGRFVLVRGHDIVAGGVVVA